MKKRRFFASILVLVLLVSAVQAGWKRYEDSVRAREYEDAARTAGLLPEPEEVQRPPSAAQPEEEAPPVPEEVRALAAIDLPALREVNPDVSGWIEIPGTDLSYPVLCGADNQYYLSRTWTGEANSGGSIFLESTNRRDLSDFHTIVYGHRMRDGSMFGSLKNYRDQTYWQEHPAVYMASDCGVYCYDIFSAQEVSVTGLVYRLDLETSGLEEDFIKTCFEGSSLDTGIVPSAEDRILTLSTCTGRGYATRWVVHAVLTGCIDRQQVTGSHIDS